MDHNDPKLTAWVLGELPEADAKELQAAIDADPELQREVDDIGQTVAQLETFLREEPLPHLAGTPASLAATPTTRSERQPTPKRFFYQSTLLQFFVVFSIIGVLGGFFVSADKIGVRTPSIGCSSSKELGIASVPVPVSPYFNGGYEDSETPSPTMPSEAPAVPKQDEPKPMELNLSPKSEQLKMEVATANPAPDTLMSKMGATLQGESKPQSIKVYPTADLVMEPITPSRTPHGIYGAMGKRNLATEEPEYRLNEWADPYDSSPNTRFSVFKENEFLKPQDAPFSTFSIDVDTASYSVTRRYLMERNQRPPADAVRLEEFVNYFDYHYAPPTDGKPFATYVDVAACPWEKSHLLARVALKGKEIPKDDRPPLNLVFLVDVSGSMSGPARLPLVQRALVELTENIGEQDRVAIVTYAGNSRVALPSISGREKRAIVESIEGLSSGGSTAGAAGIKTAYELARKHFTKNGQNRVVLCTDGDFNVGISDDSSLQKLIEQESKSGVFLTVLGFGMGNHNDRMLKILADKGNGNYGYVDNIEEARKLLVEGLTGTLITIAKDVKIQVDFNPKRVAAYRLLGYENRKLRDEDFHNDKIDAGEIGAGHSVTALYEIVPVGAVFPNNVDKSRYAEKTDDVSRVAPRRAEAATDAELMFVKLRYKEPNGDKSKLLEKPVAANTKSMSPDFEFAAAVALFGMLLREGKYSGDGNWETVKELAAPGAESDKYRIEFLELVKRAASLPTI